MPRAAALPLLVLLAAPAALAAQPVSAEELAARRERLSAHLEHVPVLVLGGAGAAAQDFAYLTGFRNSAGTALLITRDGDDVAATLFAEPGARLEAWDGEAWGTAPADGSASGLATRPVAALADALAVGMAGHRTLHVVGGGPAGAGGAATLLEPVLARAPDTEVARNRGAAALRDMRAVKSDGELELIRRAVAITVAAHLAVLESLRPGMTEDDVKERIDAAFREHGGDDRPAFAHIVASAENATILHYRGGERRIREGDHVKVDIGAAFGGYAADVTRTYPASGVFTAEQRAIYQIVRDAQAAAQAVALPGAPRAAMSEQANRVLAEGLARLGLIDSPDGVYDCPDTGLGRCSQLGLFYFHSLGHGLGLNVHDPWPAALAPGTAFVIEPGVYVRPDVLDRIPDSPGNRELIRRIRPAVERYQGIGVRIEDSYVMTENGLEWLSRVPREIHEIEAIMGSRPRP